MGQTDDPHGGTTVTALLQAPISGTVAVGSHIEQRVLNLGGVHGGVVTIVNGAVASPTPRQRPVLLRPARPELVLDRQPIRELAAPTSAIRELELYGAAGSGKTTLLEELAWTVPDSEYPDGVVYLSLGSYQINDALFDVWSAFHEGPITFKPTDAQLRIDLGPTRALVLLDDLELEPAELKRLLHLLPSCRCIVAGRQRRLWGEGRSVQLEGLPIDDAMPLIEHSIGRALSAAESSQVRALWHSTAGLPLRLQQSFAAALEGHELPSVPAEMTLDELLTGSPSELAGYVEAQTDQWRAAVLDQLVLRSQQTNRDEQADDSTRRQLERLLIEWALGTGRYEQALRLVSSTEAALARSGHWDAWLRLLEQVRAAALDAADLPTQAWALHQIGSRALCLDQLAEAETALAASLEIRTRLGDGRGAAVTRHNLRLAENLLRPLPPAVVRRRGRAALVIGVIVVAILGLVGVADAGQWWLFQPQAAHTTEAVRPTPSPSILPSVTPSPTKAPSTRPPLSASSPVTTPVSSPVTTPPAVTIAAKPTALAFNDTTVGSSSSLPVYFTVSNGSIPNLSIVNSSMFSVGSCIAAPVRVAVVTACMGRVTFLPTAAGPATATLIASTPGGSTSVMLSGSGVLVVIVDYSGPSVSGPVVTGSILTQDDISCPTTCQITVSGATQVKVTALACATQSCSYTFDGWTGACEGSGLSCSFTAQVGQDNTVKAIYGSAIK